MILFLIWHLTSLLLIPICLIWWKYIPGVATSANSSCATADGLMCTCQKSDLQRFNLQQVHHTWNKCVLMKTAALVLNLKITFLYILVFTIVKYKCCLTWDSHTVPVVCQQVGGTGWTISPPLPPLVPCDEKCRPGYLRLCTAPPEGKWKYVTVN